MFSHHFAILDIQHAGKPGKNDLGAAHDIDGDGMIGAFEHEAELTPIYATAAKAALEAAGAAVEIINSGSYTNRHKHARALAAERSGLVAYVACHLNAGGGDYGLVVSDYRSGNGGTLATECARVMRKKFADHGIRRVLTGQTAPTKRPSGSLGDRWDRLPKWGGALHWPRPWWTIKGIYSGPANLSGICYEPVFMDSHANMLDEAGLELIGQALAGGLLAYFRKVGRRQ